MLVHRFYEEPDLKKYAKAYLHNVTDLSIMALSLAIRSLIVSPNPSTTL